MAGRDYARSYIGVLVATLGDAAFARLMPPLLEHIRAELDADNLELPGDDNFRDYQTLALMRAAAEHFLSSEE